MNRQVTRRATLVVKIWALAHFTCNSNRVPGLKCFRGDYQAIHLAGYGNLNLLGCLHESENKPELFCGGRRSLTDILQWEEG